MWDVVPQVKRTNSSKLDGPPGQVKGVKSEVGEICNLVKSASW